MLARRISGFHIFGVAIVSLCLAIAILAQKEYVQNTKITVAETNAKAFGLWFGELNTSSKKPLKDKEEDCELFVGLHSGQCFLNELISEITLGDLANLRNPFVEGGNAPLFALVAAKAPYGIANGMGCSAENFEFQSGVTNSGNLLSSQPKDTRGTVVFDFEIGLATIELSDAMFKVGLCDDKGLFNQIDVGFQFNLKNEKQEVARNSLGEHTLLFYFAASANTNCRYLFDILPQLIRCLRLQVNGITFCVVER